MGSSADRPFCGGHVAEPGVSVTLAEAKRIADTLAFACRIPDKVPDFTACGGPAAEAYWAYFTPARTASLLAAIEAVLELADELEATPYPDAEEDGDVVRTDLARGLGHHIRWAITRALTGKEADGA